MRMKFSVQLRRLKHSSGQLFRLVVSRIWFTCPETKSTKNDQFNEPWRNLATFIFSMLMTIITRSLFRLSYPRTCIECLFVFPRLCPPSHCSRNRTYDKSCRMVARAGMRRKSLKCLRVVLYIIVQNREVVNRPGLCRRSWVSRPARLYLVAAWNRFLEEPIVVSICLRFMITSQNELDNTHCSYWCLKRYGSASQHFHKVRVFLTFDNV